MAAEVKGPSRIITAEKTIANREAEERYLVHLRPLLFSPLCFFTIPRIITNLEIPTYCLLQQTAPHIAKNSSVKREAWQCSDVITIPVFPVSFPMKFPRDTAWLFWGGVTSMPSFSHFWGSQNPQRAWGGHARTVSLPARSSGVAKRASLMLCKRLN